MAYHGWALARGVPEKPDLGLVVTSQPAQSTSILVTRGLGWTQRVWARRESAGWLYLGKDVARRSRVESVLQPDCCWRADDRLHRIAAELRGPFLDFVAEVGALQKNRIAWWSTTFSWKSWGSSDLFLLACYLRLAEQAIEEAHARRQSLLLLVEDRWVYLQLRTNLAGRSGVRFEGAPNLWMEKALAVARGALKRAVWLLDVVRRYYCQRRVWRGPLKHKPFRPTIGVYSFPLSRCIAPDHKWSDPFLPGLDEILAEAGYDMIRFGPPEHSGLEQELADRREFFQPLILYASISRVLRALVAFWKPCWPTSIEINGVDVGWLVRREWWYEVSTTALCMYRMYYECLCGMLSEGNWSGVVYPYENQPWEKLTVLCAARKAMRTVGVQTAAISLYYMAVFLGRGEAERMPLPDLVLTSGRYPHRILAESGYPEGRLRMSGSLRYEYLSDPGRPNPALQPAPLSQILLALPIDLYMADHLLDAVRLAYSRIESLPGLRFYVKAHPNRTIDLSHLGFPAERAPDDVTSALEKCGLVIFVGTALGPEAVALGRAALRYRPSLLVDVDLAEPCGGSIPTCDDMTMAESIKKLVANDISVDCEGARDGIREIFSPLDRGVFQSAFSSDCVLRQV